MTLHHKVSGAWRTVSQPKLKLGGAWRDASVMYTKVGGVWRQTWPDNTGAPRIVGVAYLAWTENVPEPAFSNGGGTYPAGSPRYKIVGDASQIYSAKVEIRMTPAAPKSPVEHTFSWDVTWDWGIYKVSWLDGTSGAAKYYYAGMTHAEAAAIAPPKYVTKIWTPREGGWFAYMPVCWDASGVTVPMRDDAAGGLDAHSGYAPFPPGRAATSALADYTVANGYTDMMASNGYYGYSAAAIASITIILRNSGGGVLHQYGPVALPYSTATHVPGLGTGAVLLSAQQDMQPDQFYWPAEYQNLFDSIVLFGQRNSVRWAGTGPRGDGLWKVLDRDGVQVGDFGLGFRHDAPGLIEITSSNVAPDMVGQQIMRDMQTHLLTWCPTEYVIAPPPDPITKAVMEDWGWKPINELFAPLGLEFPPDVQARLDTCIYAWANPMYNRFSELGLPPWQELIPW